MKGSRSLSSRWLRSCFVDDPGNPHPVPSRLRLLRLKSRKPPEKNKKSVLTTTDEGFIALTGAGHAVAGAARTRTNPNAGGFGPPSGANSRSNGGSPTGPISASDPFDPFDLASFTTDFAGPSGGGGGRGEDGVGDLGSGERGRGRSGERGRGGSGSRSISARKSGTGRAAGTPPFRDGGSHRVSGSGPGFGGSRDKPRANR